MPRRRSVSSRVPASVPSMRIRPEVGSIRRLTIFSDVVLPQPDGPTRQQIFPAGTTIERSLTAPGVLALFALAGSTSYRLVTWSNSTTAAWRRLSDIGPVSSSRAVRRSALECRQYRIRSAPGSASGASGPALDGQAYCRRMRITAIRLDRLVVPLDPPFPAAWDPEPRTRFPVTIVRVETDEGVVGVGSGDTMDG